MGTGVLLGGFHVKVTLCEEVCPVPLRAISAVPEVDELLAIISCPVAEPDVVGSNCRLKTALWPGFRVIGKVAPVRENPVPLTLAPLTVTGRVPVELRVTDCVEGVFKLTLPKLMLVALMLSTGTAALSCRETVFVIPPPEACSVTVCAAVTADIEAVKLAVVALAGTAAVAGTFTAVLLLVRLTAKPVLGAGPFSPIVQISVPVPVKEALAQLKLLRAVVDGAVTPVPLRATTVVAPEDELLAIASWPVTKPVAAGSN
jgi:hypothetical protein